MKTETNGGTDYEENPKGGKVAELTVREEIILKDLCTEIRQESVTKAAHLARILEHSKAVESLKQAHKDKIDYMVKRFDLTRMQVISKIIAENRKGDE